MKRFKLYSAIFVSLAVTGCATMSENECKTADWYQIGMQDGVKGRSANYLENHAKACRDYGIAPSLGHYQEGRKEGLRTFCTPYNGLHYGKSGHHYLNVCPKDMEAAFLQKYYLGLEIYNLERKLSEAYHRIQYLEERIADPKTSDFSKWSYRDDLRRTHMNKDRLQRELTALEIRATMT